MLLEFFLIGAILPWFLFFFEKILPYPYLIEEFGKLLVVLRLIKMRKKTESEQLTLIFLFVFGFTLTESIFYLNQIFLGKISLFFIRFFLTGGLHLFTTLIMYYFSGGKKLSLFSLFGGFLIAVLIHFYYNYSLLRLINPL